MNTNASAARHALFAFSLLLALFLSTQGAWAKTSRGGARQGPGDDPGCRGCLSQATSLFATGKNLEAAELLRQWSNRCPHYAQLHQLLSTILIRLGRHGEEAAEAARRAVAAAPNSTGAHFQLGLCLMSNGDNTEASQEFERVIELDPGNYEAWSTLSGLYGQLHEDGKASKAAARAADLEPGTRAVRLRTLKNLTRQGKTREAVAELKRLINSGEWGPEFMQQLAGEAISLGAYDEAIQASQTVAEAYPRSLAPLKAMASAQLAKHDYNACLSTAEKMSTIDKKVSEGHALKALVLVRLGRAQEAEKEVQAALKEEPQSALALAADGELRFSRGEFEAASEALKRSLDLDPALERDADLLFTLAQSLEKEGEKEFALNYFKESLRHGLAGDQASQARQAVDRLQVK